MQAIEADHHQIARLLVPALPTFDGTALPAELMCGATVVREFRLAANSSVLAFAAKLGRHKLICVFKHMLSDALWNAMLEHRDVTNGSAFDVACFHVRPLLYKQYSSVWNVLSGGFTGDVLGDILRIQLRGVIAEDVDTPRRLVNAQNARGFTALMLAATKGDLETSHILVNRNADLRVTTWGNVTAVLWAQWNEWLAALDGGGAAQAAKLLEDPKENCKQQLKDVSYMLNQRLRNPTDADIDGLRLLKTQYCRAHKHKDEMALRLLGKVSGEDPAFCEAPTAGTLDLGSVAPAHMGTAHQLLPRLVHMCIVRDIKKTPVSSSGGDSLGDISEEDQVFVTDYIIDPFLASYKAYTTAFADYTEEHTTEMKKVLKVATTFAAACSKEESRNWDALTNRKSPDMDRDIALYTQQTTTCQGIMRKKLMEIMSTLFGTCDEDAIGMHVHYRMAQSGGSKDGVRARFLDPLAKKDARIREKTATKYGGDLSKLRDGSRFAVVVSELARLFELATILQTPTESDPFVWEETRNRFKDATPMGWRDLQLFVRVKLPDGKTHICEIQLQLERFYQERIAEHENYGILRQQLPTHFGLEGKEVNEAMKKVEDVIQNMIKYRKRFTAKLLETRPNPAAVSVWPWESAEDAVDFHMAEHTHETVERADLIAHVCG